MSARDRAEFAQKLSIKFAVIDRVGLVGCSAPAVKTLRALQGVSMPARIVKEALARNAAAVVIAPGHPSADPIPSRADAIVTKNLRAALAPVDVKLVDHILASASSCVSMAKLGLM